MPLDEVFMTASVKTTIESLLPEMFVTGRTEKVYISTGSMLATIRLYGL
jgi:hypothetical protein